MASRQYSGQRSRTQSAASNATTQTAASTTSTSIPMPTANHNNTSAAAAATAAASSSSGTTGASQSTAPAAIRRNLFHHHLSRRLPSSATSSSAAAVAGNNGSSVGEFNPGSKAMTAAAAAAATADNVDIVVRDQNGGYRIDVPILPHSIAVDDGDGAGMEGTDSAEGDAKISEREKEKIEASLVEMMYRSRNRQMSNEPSEILALIHQSLRNKVSELDEDRWMYEVEEEIKA